ncbi:MAG: type ISP restriction/modification enzyme [Bacteroidota bacterium]
MDLPQHISQLSRQIAASLGLSYLNPQEAGGAVCYASVPGLRPEYRQSFAPADVLDYLYALLLHKPADGQDFAAHLSTQPGTLPYPTDVDTFWQLVAIGSRLRHTNPLGVDELEGLVNVYLGSGDAL